MSNSIRLYITPETRAKIDRLLALLAARGVHLLDNRGHSSKSALLARLVDQELNRLTADPDAPFPETDPWDEMGV